MADNYLEKQYELYQARKAEWEKKKKLGKYKPTHHPATGQTEQPDSSTPSKPETQTNHE